jgi:hypothetical protein
MKIVITYVDIDSVFGYVGHAFYKTLEIPVPVPEDVICQIMDLRDRGHQISTPDKETFIFPAAILKAEIIKGWSET